MSTQLVHSMFHEVFFPQGNEEDQLEPTSLHLKKVLRFRAHDDQPIHQIPWVVFDFETTGLDSRSDQIIEIGALKTLDGKIIDEISYLIDPGFAIDDTITKITGITPDMLVGKPKIDEVWGEFLEFIKGSLLVAHNAEFDWGFLTQASDRLGFQVHWPCFCSLKLARELLPDLESKNLDTLAEHYDLTFEARHRSIGDCKVTYAVLRQLLDQEGAMLQTWGSLQPYHVGQSAS